MFANRVVCPAALTTAGVEQAHVLAEILATLSVSHLYTSPLLQARQTVDVIASRLQIEPIERDMLREYDVGDFEGMAARRRGEGSSTSGWKQRGAAARTMPASPAASDTLVVVSYRELYRVMFPLFLAEISAEFARAHLLGHCESIVAVWDRAAWRCTQWGDASFEALSLP